MNLLLASVLLLQDQSAEETFKKIEDTFEKAKTISVQIKIDASESPEGRFVKTVSSGSLLIKNARKLRLDLKGQTTLGTRRVDSVTHIQCDGKDRLHAVHLGEEFTVAKTLKSGFAPILCRSGVGIGFPTLLSASYGPDRKETRSDLDLTKEFQVSEFRMGQSTGSTAQLSYTLTVASPEDSQKFSVKLWYDPKSLMLQRREAKTLAEKDPATFVETYEDLKLDADILDEKFKLPKEKK